MSYVDARGNDKGAANCLPEAQTMDTGWYVARNETFDERVEVTGDVNLILADGCTMKANDGIHLQENSSLTIWAQSMGDSMGALEAKNSDINSWIAAIGGNAQTDGDRKYTAYTGSVTINGGKILADGGPRAFEEDGVGGPGICASNVTINGGDIKAWGKGCGASVSGAGIAATSTIINGGTVEAKGRAGIGGNRAEDMDGNITINGGTVNATGLRAGVGLGAAYRGTMRGRITIAGGTVTANGGNGAGIGCGQEGTLTGDILISGGKVIAEDDKGNGAGIGCGNTGAVSGTITISGGHVTADAHTGIGAGYGGVIF